MVGLDDKIKDLEEKLKKAKAQKAADRRDTEKDSSRKRLPDENGRRRAEKEDFPRTG